MLSVVSNYGVMLGHRGLMNAQAIINQAAERLMTGKRINRASDDPAGMIALTELEIQAMTLTKEIEALDAKEGLLGSQEGALSVMNDLLLNLEGLVVQAANTGAMTVEDREALQIDADEILEELDRIWITSKFKGERIFDGIYTTGAGRVRYGEREQDPTDDLLGQFGPDSGLYATLAAIGNGNVLNLVDGDLEGAQKSVEGALKTLNHRRALIGAEIKHNIQSMRAVKLVELENITQAKSDIGDADIAAEMASFIRGQFLQQASIASILIARQSPNAALQLLANNVRIAQGQ